MIPLRFLSLIKRSEIAKTAQIYPMSVVRSSKVADFTYISYGCVINNCEIGKFCSIAKGVSIGLGKHPTNFMSTSPIFYSSRNPLRKKLISETLFKENEKTKIGNDVWIGAGTIILDGISIGDGSIVGANSVVNKDIPPFTIVGGIPARKIRDRFNESLINDLLELKWWDLPSKFLKDKVALNLFAQELTYESMAKLRKQIETYEKKEI